MRVLLYNLIQRQVIHSSESEYNNPIVLCKKNTGEIRMCIDYRALTEVGVRNKYSLLLIDGINDNLCNKQWFPVFNFRNGFLHDTMSEGSTKVIFFDTTFRETRISEIGEFDFRQFNSRAGSADLYRRL